MRSLPSLHSKSLPSHVSFLYYCTSLLMGLTASVLYTPSASSQHNSQSNSVKPDTSCLFSAQNIPLALHLIQRQSQSSYNVLWGHHSVWSLAISANLFPTTSLSLSSSHTAHLILPGIHQTCIYLMISGSISQEHSSVKYFPGFIVHICKIY